MVWVIVFVHLCVSVFVFVRIPLLFKNHYQISRSWFWIWLIVCQCHAEIIDRNRCLHIWSYVNRWNEPWCLNIKYHSTLYVDMYRDGAPSIGSQQGEANVYVQYQRKGDSLKCFRTISKMFTSNSSGKCLRPKSAETRLLKMFSSNISRKCLRPISAERRLFKIWNWTTTACWHAEAKYSQAKISNTLLVDLWAALRMNSKRQSLPFTNVGSS